VLRDTGERIEQLLDELQSAEPACAAKAEEAVRLIVEFYGAGLTRLVEELGTQVTTEVAGDPLVASLLLLHNLHPVPVETRIETALDTVRPYMGSHGGWIAFDGINDDGVAHVTLQGSCSGCPSSLITMKSQVEQAVAEAAPELTGIDVEGVTEPEAVTTPVELTRRQPVEAPA
jgi:Fe-S cluster biogenesis protein NfuA